MKTILYNPIFINPQAYYVFPRLTRYLQPDNESTAEPANYIGTIEVKVIAYGDTTLKRTYTNTDSIDLSEFKNTWIRISLFTKVGSCVLGEWKIGNMESDLPYIDPEVLASLKAVVIVGNKTNNDSDRAIVKNLVDPDNPFVISNAAYTEGSGYADKGSPYYGAFVTDGIDDLITSTKTASEMGITNEVTVVSMIHQIRTNGSNINRNNFFCNKGLFWFSNNVINSGKTGIYGYTSINNSVNNIINNILGDKNDYSAVGDKNDITPSQFSVVGYIGGSTGEISYTSSVAWFWTIIANKVLTTDQINQVIAYFNLDRTLNPDILCNTIKQGITNENHAEFGDKLIDFSGNGRDIQLTNIAWKGDSGIGKYEVDFSTLGIGGKGLVYEIKAESLTVINSLDTLTSGYCNIQSVTTAFASFKIRIEGLKEGEYVRYHYNKNTDDTARTEIDYTSDGIYELPASVSGNYSASIAFGYILLGNSKIIITQIPSHAGALCLDGINDFGKVTGMPIYKDYTFIIDYERISYASSEKWVAGVVSKSHVANQGAFILMTANTEVEPGKQAYSFGGVTSFNRDDFTRALLYQSKYKCGDVDLTVGEGVDSDTLWLGTFRDNDQRFFNGAIYSLMSFPYSMSEFLIERQLKKHKLGTLYPNMVEFRPVIKSNASYDNIVFYYKNEKVENGTYLTVGSSIGMHIRLSSSPVNEIKSITVNGIPATFKYHDANNNIYQYDFNLTSKSPQKINITIDEYIRFEDIVQPYPVLLRFKDENGNEVSWGGKFRVGSTITRIGSAADSNLLPNIYNIFGLLLNDNQVTSSKVIVEKTMVFKAKSAYIFDNNEPKVILSPSRLRIPNSSYKILGYIPDISGHGNHGVIHNSAYTGMSGANGYTEDFTKWTLYTGVKCTDSIISLDSSFNKQDQWILFKPKGSNINQFTINIKGIPDGGNLYLRLSTDSNIKLENGINEISSYTNVTNSTGFFIGANGLNLDWSNLVIEQVGEYEGAYCLDGVDDFVTIPTVTGGKQVLMKVNWQSIAGTAILYDQRTNGGFAIFNRDYDTNENKVPAYRARNIGGNTYIDGILNEYIYASQLQNITHNIVELYDPELNIGTLNPKIGSSYLNSNYAQMSLYDFMLFDNISTDDKIKQLNEYVGIEGNTEWRKTK